MKFISKEDWIKTATTTIVKNGNGSFSIESLCKKLEVSKGSFYHHFKNRQELVKEILSKWQDESTLQIIELANKNRTSKNRLRLLTILTHKLSSDAEISIRAWSKYEILAKEIIENVDRLRINFIKDLLLTYCESNKEAKKKAIHLYAVFLGSRTIEPPLSNSEINNLYAEILSSLKFQQFP